jgi:hypothetical protein
MPGSLKAAQSLVGRQIETPLEEWIVTRVLLPIARPILGRIVTRVLPLVGTRILLWTAGTQDLIGTVDLIGMLELIGIRLMALLLEIRQVIPVIPALIPTRPPVPSRRGKTRDLISRCPRPR